MPAEGKAEVVVVVEVEEEVVEVEEEDEDDEETRAGKVRIVSLVDVVVFLQLIPQALYVEIHLGLSTADFHDDVEMEEVT